MVVVTCFIVFLASCVALCSPLAQMGSGFAEAYGAFAPLVALHRIYADHLFYGSEISIPEGVASACDETGYQLALLHLELLSQTKSQVVATRPRLTRLRADLALCCEAHSQTLSDISLGVEVDVDVLKSASDEGLFSGIYALQQGLQLALETVLEEIGDEQGTWEFAVAFALKTVLDQQRLSQLDAGLQDILYGSDQADAPPAFVPQDVAQDIVRLAEFVDIPIALEMEGALRELIQSIYEYVLNVP